MTCGRRLGPLRTPGWRRQLPPARMAMVTAMATGMTRARNGRAKRDLGRERHVGRERMRPGHDHRHGRDDRWGESTADSRMLDSAGPAWSNSMPSRRSRWGESDSRTSLEGASGLDLAVDNPGRIASAAPPHRVSSNASATARATTTRVRTRASATRVSPRRPRAGGATIPMAARRLRDPRGA